MIADATFYAFSTDYEGTSGNYNEQDGQTLEEPTKDSFLYLNAWQSEIDAGQKYAHINDGLDTIYVLGSESPYFTDFETLYSQRERKWEWQMIFTLPYVERGKTEDLVPVAIIDRHRRIILENPNLE